MTGIRVAPRRETFRGSPGSPAVPIGTYTLAEPITVRNSFEVAAWWSDVLLEPGTYEVTANGYYAFYTVPGTIVSEYTPSLFGGVAVGSQPQYEQHRSVGQSSSHHVQTYLYELAGSLADPNSPFEPLPHVEPVLTGWCEHVYRDHRSASPLWGVVLHEEAA